MEAQLTAFPANFPVTSCSAVCAEVENSPDYSLVREWIGEWIVCCVNPQQTQYSIDTIEGFEVPIYCPREIVTQWKDKRRREISRPLFPGYLFACVPDPMFMPDTLRDWKIIQLIRVKNQDRLRKELGNLQAGLAADPYAQRHAGLKEGNRVRVASGPLLGIEGVVERVGMRDLLFIRVTTLSQSVSVEISAAMVEPL